MGQTTYPFPLSVNSSHHSHYHRFLLGADAALIDPIPKPYCIGALATSLGALANELNLQKWRKLYAGAFPWVSGFDAGHYAIGNVAPHCSLPRDYCRPQRRFGAYDLVHVADPSLSALALVAGDRRIIDRYARLSDEFCRLVESGAGAHHSPNREGRLTGRILAGQFFEPNNRWLMPFLHVHTRVLNFTAFVEKPNDLLAVDSSSLARSAQRHLGRFLPKQAELLSDLGYTVAPIRSADDSLCVDGVSEKLVAAIQAPRIAVMRILERMLVGDAPSSASNLQKELPLEVIAAMTQQLEVLIANALSIFKPVKMGIPADGPWRSAVRDHLYCICPDSLERLDLAASRARAVFAGTSIYPSPLTDHAHCHGPQFSELEARIQHPMDPELGATNAYDAGPSMRSDWLAAEFERTLNEVNERIVRAGANDPLVSLRKMTEQVDRAAMGADPIQLRQAYQLLSMEVGRRQSIKTPRDHFDRGQYRGSYAEPSPLDEYLERTESRQHECVREMGGRSL